MKVAVLDLAPEIYRQRLVVEGLCRKPIDASDIRDYLSKLSEIIDMVTLTEPVTHRSPLYGWAGWIHWETSGAHFYAWETPKLFFSVDVYACKSVRRCGRGRVHPPVLRQPRDRLPGVLMEALRLVFDPSGDVLQAARACEADIFYQAYGNSPQLLAEEYAAYEGQLGLRGACRLRRRGPRRRAAPGSRGTAEDS
jgi:S-adenosylmethionine decarboxylase